MLAIQEYLKTNTPESLAEKGIYCYRHPHLPLVGFKYDQIEANKSCPIVREARGIVLEDRSWALVAKGFNRFYNLGEFQEELKNFNWNDFSCNTKEDGSLILLHHYNGEWHVNTSGSFGLGNVNRTEKTWRDLFWETSKLQTYNLNTNRTYVFELCTPHNKIVRMYRPSVFLLSVFYKNEEEDEEETDAWAEVMKVQRPKRWDLKSREELLRKLDEISSEDPTFEGFVIRDSNNLRFKCKTDSYKALHQLKDNGNIILPERLVTLCLKGDKDKTKALVPEISSAIETVDAKLKEEYTSLEALWKENKNIEIQKDFAMKIKDHKFSNILFAARKTGKDIETLWKSEPEKISEKIFGKQIFEFDPPPVSEGI